MQSQSMHVLECNSHLDNDVVIKSNPVISVPNTQIKAYPGCVATVATTYSYYSSTDSLRSYSAVLLVTLLGAKKDVRGLTPLLASEFALDLASSFAFSFDLCSSFCSSMRVRTSS